MDPNPIKHLGSLMKVVRVEVEPALLAAGFVFTDRSENSLSGGRNPWWFDYCRSQDILSIRYDAWNCRLIAEILNDKEASLTIAVTEMNNPSSTPTLMMRINAFTSAVKEFLARITAGPRSDQWP